MKKLTLGKKKIVENHIQLLSMCSNDSPFLASIFYTRLIT